MKNQFLGDHFLLKNEAAVRLYFDYAASCPIIDYHCHLPPEDIASNRQFNNLTSIWLEGDHYKWRAMRANGVKEAFITGAASDAEKFMAWAETVPYTLRNPLYHWTHLELKRYFGIQDILCPKTASDIYQKANEYLASPAFCTQALLQKMQVEVVCTSDDPIDDLKHHQNLKKQAFGVSVLPTWRPDRLLAIEDVLTFNAYVEQLGERTNSDIRSFDDLLQAIQQRHDFFNEQGCRLADHGLNHFLAHPFTRPQLAAIFAKLRSKKSLTPDEVLAYQSGIMYHLAVMNFEKDWAQQFHVGALRNTNPRSEKELGLNTGFDSIGKSQDPSALARFLGQLDAQHQLAKTILYNSNPADNYLYAAMTGNFQDGSFPGKIQHGAAWWFLDQKEGIELQLNALSHIGLLSRFVGMVTDSRSFLSYPRHEYFRRILCQIIGQDMEDGLLPYDMNWIGKMVQDICYYNAQNYFSFPPA
ncbi:MAG TPA: glucuronate isomerase [Saprospiraceae bacterium]|nr:glucuronate isomerase [Saprospiraceae bacterium]HMQ81701.1 glucuronate isomerase [Saprospiraceae bacterium]